MGFTAKQTAAPILLNLGSLDVTGTNETKRAISPSGIAAALRNRYNLTDRIGKAYVLRPFGFTYVITTGITVTAAVVKLWRNGAAAATTGGEATLAIQALGANEVWVALSDYYTLAADAAADVWSLKVTTTATAGVVNPVVLWCAFTTVPGINVGVASE